MKKSMIVLAAGLLFSSMTMALSTPGSASQSPTVMPCGKTFSKQISRDDKKTNFYQVALAKAAAAPHSGKPVKSAN